MARSHGDPEGRERHMDEVIGGYLEAVAAGHGPDRQELIGRHPELAAELSAFFADYDRLHRLAEPLRPVAQAAQAAVPVTEPAPAHTNPDPHREASTGAGPSPTL